jgi:tRNA(His) 5'-end guanylyltransferase
MENQNISLKERMTALRNTTNYILPLKSYVMVMIDGRSFSRVIKNNYEKPFDDKFINMMNEVAKYVCKNVQGCKFAYAQSDEITFVLTDFDTETTNAFFGNRITKILSIIPSMASAKFNQLIMADLCDIPCSNSDLKQMILNLTLCQFDGKCFSLNKLSDVYSYYLWRQIDCIRNSKQQTAQTWISHKTLNGLDTDEQIKLLLDEKGIDWNTYEDGKKYGRFIYKEIEHFHNDKLNTDYDRTVWKEHPAFPIMGNEGKEKFLALNQIPDIDDVRPDEYDEIRSGNHLKSVPPIWVNLNLWDKFKF